MPLGKTALAESVGLPPPSPPSRAAFPKRADLLDFHGFDVEFDQRVRRAADAIIGEETPLDAWLQPALDASLERRALARLPGARVRLSKPLAEQGEAPSPPKDAAASALEAKKAAAAAEALAEAHGRVIEILASTLVRCDVGAADITVAREQGRMTCIVRLSAEGASMYSVVEALTAAAADAKRFPDLHEALIEAGCSETGAAVVEPVWPLERVQEELRLAFPEHETSLEALARALPLVIAKSWTACQKAWERVGGESPADLEPLATQASLARFDGELLSHADARRGGSFCEDPRSQGATCLDDLIADAAEAQAMLKEALAEGSTWSKARMDDAREPVDSSRRTWTSSASDLAPRAEHHDPGVKKRHVAFEKAKRFQRGYEAHPPVHELLDLSRLSITFGCAADAAAGVSQILGRFEVAWLANGFRSPSCLGFREMEIGIEQQVVVQSDDGTSRRGHISEIQVRLKTLHEARLGDESNAMAAIQNALSGCGLPPPCLERGAQLASRALACTDGSAAREADNELARAAAHYAAHAAQLSAAGLQTAEELVSELADQALDAGVGAPRVVSMLELAPLLNEKRALRDQRVALVDALGERLAAVAGVDFNSFFQSMLDDIAALPSDQCGRVCLLGQWWESPRFAACDASWHGVQPGGRLCFREECQGLAEQARAINARERELRSTAGLRVAVTDLRPELAELCVRSASRQLGEAVLRFLLARGAGWTPEPHEIVAASEWAQASGGADAETLGKVAAFLRWAQFEDQLSVALVAMPSAGLLAALREALSAERSSEELHERAECAGRWQHACLHDVCARLGRRDRAALPIAMVLLELGQAEVREQVAHAMAGPDDSPDDGDWPEFVVEAGALPLLAACLACRSEGKVAYRAAFAVRYLCSQSGSRPAISEGGLIPRLAQLAIDGRLLGEDVSFIAMSALGHLARKSEEDAEAIRQEGLSVDSVGRVKKKKG